MNNKDSGINIMRATKIITNVFKHRLIAFLSLLLVTSLCSAQESVVVTGIAHTTLPGGTVQINVIADGELVKPGSFSTHKPARIALDFFGAKRDLSNGVLNIGVGKVDSVVAVETVDRTRVIINLFDSARYEISPSSNGYAITVYNDSEDLTGVVTPKPFVRRPDITPETTITNIDFRRSKAGGGTLIVDLSDDKATIDTRARDGDIIVDLLNVNLPQELERRLDVVDFATPVQTIDSFQNSNNVRLVIIPEGRQQHISFQSGSRFTLTIDPILEPEIDLVNEEDAALGFKGERLSINFQNIDIRSALTVIADFTGINFVTSDSVEGEITINLKDVPWDQALDVILRTKGLSKRQTGNVLWVAPSSEIADVEKQELEDLLALEEKAPLVSEIIQINYAKAEDIADVVKSVRVVAQGALPSGTSDNVSGASITETDKNSLLTTRGSVTVDARTNSLLVQDVASKIKELRSVIAKLDKPVRQVLIETRIVEANDDFSRELGVRLGFQQVANVGDNGTVFSGGSIAGNSTIVNSVNEQEVDSDGNATSPIEFDVGSDGLAVDFGANALSNVNPASYALDIFRAGSSFSQLISLELSALEADERGKVVASPRLITTNQQEASISQGLEVFVTVEGGDGGSGSLEVIEAELQLIVTPQITPDDRIIMDVEINQNSLVGAQSVSTNEIETQVLANNGETVVIGGIYQEDLSETIVKVPVLGDIPYLKNLFRQKSIRKNRTELLIFLTPKIISPKLNLG